MRLARDSTSDKTQSLDKHIIPVLDKNISFPTKGALLYNTGNPSDVIHYADGTNWIPLATGGITGLNNEGGGVEIFDQIIGTTAVLRTLVAGSDISITQNPTTITISSTGGGASSNNYVFSYDTTFQPIVTPNTFQDITFNTNGIINGWTHVLPTSSFICPITGVYSITAVTSFSKTTGANRITSVMITLNGVEIPGSQTVGFLAGTAQSIVVDLTNFLASVNAGDDLKVRWTSDGTLVRLDPTIGSSTIGVIPSAKLAIIRIA